MKLFWKQFWGILIILIVMFTVFGSALIQSSFQASLENELNVALEEAAMFQYTILSSTDSLSENYRLDEKVLVDVIRTIDENIGNAEETLILYDSKFAVLYQKGSYQNTLSRESLTSGELYWQLTDKEGSHYLETMVQMIIDEDVFYIEKNRNVQQVYDNRAILLQQYRMSVGILSLVATVLAAGMAYSFTAPVRKLSQATRAFAKGDYASRVTPKGKDEMAVLMRDFNIMAERLEENIWELNDAVRRQEEFTGAFAHELKTPLTSIIGYSELLMSTELSEEARMMSAGYIYQDGKRLERLAYKMMELTRVDKQEITFGCLSVKELMSSLQATALPMLTEKSITLTINVEDGCVYGDKDLLLSFFLNLVDNGRKACDVGGNIQIRGRKAGKGYQFQIRDDGRGIPQEELSHITEAFYMVDKSRARKEGGAGLGMALCAKILELHGGKWRLKSKMGEGTAVNVWLPGKEEA